VNDRGDPYGVETSGKEGGIGVDGDFRGFGSGACGWVCLCYGKLIVADRSVCVLFLISPLHLNVSTSVLQVSGCILSSKGHSLRFMNFY
jgi:hypothetical protein